MGGTLFFQGQRLFFHNATGNYGSIPSTISGDMDINPDDGECRLSCQVFLSLDSYPFLRVLHKEGPQFDVANRHDLK